MKVSVKKSAIACTAAAVMLSGMGFTSIAANAATAITLGPTMSQPDQPVEGLNGWPFNGANLFAPDESPDSLITDLKVVNYDTGIFFMGHGITEGAVNGANIVSNTLGKKVVIGNSKGAAAAEEMISIIVSDPNRPADDELKFIMIGSIYAENGIGTQNPGGSIPILGASFLEQQPDSPYQIIYISKEGDIFADRPENMNFWSAVIGFGEHRDYSGVDMTRTDLLIKVDGNRTYVIVPQGDLELLKPLRAFAEAIDRTFGTTVAVAVVDGIQSFLKQQANPVYNREGYVRVDEYVPPAPKAVTEFVSDVPDSVLSQGDSPAAAQSRFVSLDVSSESVPPAASGGAEAVAPPPVTEEIVVDKVEVPEETEPVVTPEPEPAPVAVSPEPVVEQKPEPVSNDKKDAGTEANDGNDDDGKDEKKGELRKKPGSSLNQSAVRSHRGVASVNDNDKDDKPSASAGSTSSPSAGASNSSNTSSSNSGSNTGGTGGGDE